MTALAKTDGVESLPLAAPASGNPLMEMLSEAIRAGQPIEVIREIKDMVKEIAADEARRAFDEAVANAKAELKPIVRNRKGHNSKYADLAAVADAVDPIISQYGLSYRHRAQQGDKGITITCILSHKQGHYEETSLSAGPDTSGNKNSIQAIGSAQTYLMRYTLLLALGLATTNDDDGKAAGAGETISEEQLATIRGLIESTGSDVARFCAFFKIEALPDLPAAQFQTALNTLNAKRARA